MTTVLTKSFPQETPPFAKTLPGKKRVLIVGGGFSGIAVARALKLSQCRNNADRPA
jgi:NADH:ubiquinone reductase (H+-translocating)